MALMRTTWFFKLGGYGWTENFHSTITDVNALVTRVETLAPYRKALLAQDAQLVAVRISDDDIFRDSVFLQNPPIYGQGTYPGTSDPAFTSLLTRWDASNVTRKNLYLRGIQDDLVQFGNFQNDATWAPRWAAYKAQVTGLGFGIKRIKQTANPQYSIYSVDNTGVASTSTAHTFTIGQRVHITGIRTSPKVPNLMTVLGPITTFSFVLANWAPRPAVYPNNARVRLGGFEVVAIISGVWERIVKKSTGRPFDTPHGRRRRVA